MTLFPAVRHKAAKPQFDSRGSRHIRISSSSHCHSFLVHWTIAQIALEAQTKGIPNEETWTCSIVADFSRIHAERFRLTNASTLWSADADVPDR